MAQNYPLRIEAGATYSRTFRVKKNSDGSLFDLSGFTALAQIRKYPSTELALEITPTIDVENSTVTLRIEADETSMLEAHDHLWGCELYNETDTIRLIEGKVSVSPEVVY